MMPAAQAKVSHRRGWLRTASSGEAATPTLGALSFAGATDWFAGTHAGTHHEVWAGNTSRDTLTMGYAPKMPLAYGGHTWFGGPRGYTDVSRGVTIYSVASLGTGLRLGLVEINHATGARTEVTLFTGTAPALDNHYVLSIYKRADGKYVAMWAFHDYDGVSDTTLRWYVSPNANSIAGTWTSFSKNGVSVPDGLAYPTIVPLAGDGNRVAVIVRSGSAYGGDNQVHYATSTDDLNSTANLSAFTLMAKKQLTGGDRAHDSYHGVYYHAYPDPDHTDRIWFCASDYYNNTAGAHQVDDVVCFYGTFSGGVATFYAPDGTSLGADVDWTELTAGNLGLAYDSGAAGTSSWVWDIVVKNGKVYVAFVQHNSLATGTDYDYKVAVITYTGTPSLSVGTAWDSSVDGTNNTLAGTGKTDTTPYAAGISLDKTNPQRAYISFGTSTNDTTGRCKIRLVTTANDWSTKTITTPSFLQGRLHNYHPYMPFVSDYTTAPPSFCEMTFETGYLNSWNSVFAMFVTPEWNGALHALDLNEASGTPANKLFFASVLGTVAKVSTPTMGATGINNGKAMTFNGSSTALDTGIAPQITRLATSVIMHWTKLAGVAAQQLVGASDAGSGRKFWGINASNQTFLGVGTASGAGSATGLTAGAWAHWGVLLTLSGGNPQFDFHVNGVSKGTVSNGYSESGLKLWIGAINSSGSGSNWASGDFAQYVVDGGESRDAAWLATIAGYASAGTFTSASKVASVTNGPVVGPTVTPSATLPAGASYTLKLISTSTPAGQTKTGTAATPIVFDSVTIANGDSVSIQIAAASSDKTVAPSFTSFSLAA